MHQRVDQADGPYAAARNLSRTISTAAGQWGWPLVLVALRDAARTHGSRTVFEMASATIEAFEAAGEPPADDARKLLERLAGCLSVLCDESYGVIGLHRNGDVAPWDELRRGGNYEEWLGSLDDALDYLGSNPSSAAPSPQSM